MTLGFFYADGDGDGGTADPPVLDDPPVGDDPPVDDPPVEDPPQKKPVNGYQKRINELTRDKYEMKERLANLEGRLQSQPPQQQQPPPEPEKAKPKMDDYDDTEKYYEELAEWKAEKIVDKRLKINKAEQERSNQRYHANTVEQKWQTKQQAAKEKFEDFEEVVSNSEVYLTAPMAGVAKEVLDGGAEVLYYLAQNPVEAETISRMTNTYQVTAAMSKIEERIKSGTKKPSVSKTPPPTTKLKSGGSGVDKAPNDKDSADEWRRKRNAQVRKRKGIG